MKGQWLKEFGATVGVPDVIAQHPALGDVSWHNDVCPSFVAEPVEADDATALRLWVDFETPADREEPEAVRFRVWDYVTKLYESETDAEGAIAALLARHHVAVALADTFGRLLLAELGPATFAEAVRLNAARAPGAAHCHSHDFCDANMIMESAFIAVVGRATGELADAHGNDTDDVRLVNRAWSLWQLRGGSHV